MQSKIEQKYNNLFEKYLLEKPLEAKKVNLIIKKSIQDFLAEAKNPSIYCYGGHTKMLMADFIYELKPIKYIIDNYTTSSDNTGYKFIKDDEIEDQKIDSVIISSFKFRKEIKQGLREKHPEVRLLDLYDEFESNGIFLNADYYYYNHPYHHYHTINLLQRKIRQGKKCNEQMWVELITHYLHIKDFRTAGSKAEQLYRLTDKQCYQELRTDIGQLYEEELKIAESFDISNVIMFCFDGLRRRDLYGTKMPHILQCLKKDSFVFQNAYSCSTSTYESLVPAYSGNMDLRTCYFEKNYVDIDDCSFAQEVIRRGDHLYIYGDMDHFIEAQEIIYSNQFQTVTEKIWNMLIDGEGEKRSLFYLHELYESHFTFSNPYTEDEIKTEGTAMLFDYLPQKGGKLRADYKKQHEDSLRYLDDVVTPFFEKLKCKMVVFADHGNLILDKNTEIQDVNDLDFTCSAEWTEIPLLIRNSKMGVGVSNKIISLIEMPEIIKSLLEGRDYNVPNREYIKIVRSELYNPDFRFLYSSLGKETYLNAFEAFVFADGYKLIIFSNGEVELYNNEETRVLGREDLVKELVLKVKTDITVCDLFA